ncbi:MAG: NrtA/SsuA/CpmA family ABC transporter substrate-binding protein [Desulfobacterales bacterium]|nr:NrtA/SsuA/CpmA family ABC transporter substrate-binding protein [Desulfobacterales bacterium]
MAILILWCYPAGAQQTSSPVPLELSLATQAAPYSGLVLIAAEKGYFREAGLEVTLNLYASGKEAMEAMCQGKAHLATAADIAFAAKALAEPSIRVLASIGTTTGSQIIARRDRGIQTPADLRGKKIGFTAHTTSDYFLFTFLVIENIPQEDITFVDMPADQQVAALESGAVDAVSAFEIFAFDAQKRLGANAVHWDIQNNLAFHWLLTTKADFLDRPEPFRRFFEALIKAEHFVRANDQETRNIISRQWGFGTEFLQESWPKTRLSVTFGQSIVTSLRSYMGWQLRKAGQPMAPPEVLNYLHTGILDGVAPKTVTIFR